MAGFGQRHAVFWDMGQKRAITHTFFEFVSTWTPGLSVEVDPHCMPIPLTEPCFSKVSRAHGTTDR